ncbi:hypothetical protein [Orientia tsutsugamushi]|uniref:Uncharacterized protein n=1 Tax=Orientia tsutsugamushi TaxID=784 RepID=A0A2U3QTM1_ORITS|nr:hypothetical protein [Orientia tsutsugamushi]KJV51108.1 hypothetical protein OTSKATO_1537 [Orientia tsutsugamushi str. Kato PP]SPR04302.1 Uncharacterised protein [Orientia tsutsugamushi]SPR08583.1 Uncharacterised protein [Orientia tsutsugamushi]
MKPKGGFKFKSSSCNSNSDFKFKSNGPPGLFSKIYKCYINEIERTICNAKIYVPQNQFLYELSKKIKGHGSNTNDMIEFLEENRSVLKSFFGKKDNGVNSNYNYICIITNEEHPAMQIAFQEKIIEELGVSNIYLDESI